MADLSSTACEPGGMQHLFVIVLWRNTDKSENAAKKCGPAVMWEATVS